MRQFDNRGWQAVLVDDDVHSARQLLRTFSEYDAELPRWLGNGERAKRTLAARFAEMRSAWPSLVIVDLKASSSATRDFIDGIRSWAHATNATIVAWAPDLDKPVRDALHIAGAAAVFQRHSDIAAYRHEVADLVSFWARNQRLDAVGT